MAPGTDTFARSHRTCARRLTKSGLVTLATRRLLIQQYGGNPAYAVVSGVQWILNLVVTVLLNMPDARAWFAAMKRNPRGSA